MIELTTIASGRQRTLALAATFIAACGWGMSPVFVVLAHNPALVVTFFRLVLGAGLTIAATYALGRRLTWTGLRSSWLGGVLLCGDMAMFFSAVKLTAVVDASFIMAAQPVIVVVAAHRLFGEHLKRRDLILIAGALVCVAIVIGNPISSAAPRSLEGDLLAVGATVFWSAYWLVSKRARSRVDTVTYTAGVTITAAIVMCPIVLLSGQALDHVTKSDWLWISLLAVIPGGGHALMNWAQPFVDASISSALGAVNPLSASVAAMLILHQRLSSFQIAGGLVALAALACLAIVHRGALLSLPASFRGEDDRDDRSLA